MTDRERLLSARREELLTVKEYAAVVRVHERSLRRRIRRGVEPGAVRVGGQWRIDLACSLLRPSASR